MQPWQQFEDRVYKESWARGIFVSRIPTGCRIIFAGGRKKTVFVKTDFDFCAGDRGKSIFFDVKATAGTRFNLKTYVTADKKIHQFHKMREAFLMGNSAGYLIWFYDLGKIVWAPIGFVDSLVRDLGGAKAIVPDMAGCKTQDDFIALDIGKLAGTSAV